MHFVKIMIVYTQCTSYTSSALKSESKRSRVTSEGIVVFVRAKVHSILTG